jgi:hypothetical protein
MSRPSAERQWQAPGQLLDSGKRTMKGNEMGGMLEVVQDADSGDWQVKDKDTALITFHRFQDARAFARAVLLERGKGSVVLYTPSGRPREKLQVRQADGHVVVHAA